MRPQELHFPWTGVSHLRSSGYGWYIEVDLSSPVTLLYPSISSLSDPFTLLKSVSPILQAASSRRLAT